MCLHRLTSRSCAYHNKSISGIRSQYLNNNVEQDHGFLRKTTRPMLGFKAIYSAAPTRAGIEAAHDSQGTVRAEWRVAFHAVRDPRWVVVFSGNSYSTSSKICDRIFGVLDRQVFEVKKGHFPSVRFDLCHFQHNLER
ncbi:DDE-type integrase/transposase/recombinase [Celeribacter baekdonensis]|uniref:DDE-type integrase/transposase/recombinase n=1 Tax=Celeribacter baekdonensis TaxID=875171 RepID=UPI003F6D6DF9